MLIRQAFIDTILRQLLAKRTDPNFVNQIFCVQLRSPLVLPPIRFVLEHASLADFHSSALFPRFAARDPRFALLHYVHFANRHKN